VRWTVKLVLCFLIAWLPSTGFAAPALLCTHASSDVSATHVAAARTTSHTADMRAAAPAFSPDQPACHGSAGTVACSCFAVPAEVVVPAMAVLPSAYALRNSPLFSQFIPDLPQRPPQGL
jgi:hypothetical protein